MGYRVVQWTTGNVGRRAVAAIVAHPDLELVGCYAWSPDKVGADVGELCDLGPIGVVATDDVDALLALDADCVVYTPMWIDVDEMCRILASGTDIVSTAAFITGHSLGEGRQRILDACAEGGSTVFGSGINPGFADLVALTSASACDRIDKITITEAADIAGYDSPETELPVGFARPVDDPELQAMTARGTAVFQDVVHLFGQALGVEFDEVVCEATYSAATEHVDLGSWAIEPGCVAGVAASWHGRVAGRSIVELRIRWRKTEALDPPIPIDPGYHIEIDGRPTIRVKLDLLPPPDFQATTFGEFMVLGMIATVMPAIDAIPHVVAADPGILTYADGLLPLPKGLVVL